MGVQAQNRPWPTCCGGTLTPSSGAGSPKPPREGVLPMCLKPLVTQGVLAEHGAPGAQGHPCWAETPRWPAWGRELDHAGSCPPRRLGRCPSAPAAGGPFGGPVIRHRSWNSGEPRGCGQSLCVPADPPTRPLPCPDTPALQQHVPPLSSCAVKAAAQGPLGAVAVTLATPVSAPPGGLETHHRPFPSDQTLP